MALGGRQLQHEGTCRSEATSGKVRSYRRLFLSSMGAVYFCAFATYYLQYPGILGADGLLPAHQYWKQVRKSRWKMLQMDKPLYLDLNIPLAWWTKGLLGSQTELAKLEIAAPGKNKELRGFLDFPSLLWFLDEKMSSLSTDQVLEGLALLGMILSAMSVLGIHNILIFVALYVNYLSLFLLGQRWLGFQWDIFLLETGAMMLLYCPLLSIRSFGEVPPVAWLLRVLIAKFMYMNGVVKITANCPTWKHLTALEYHFASTCLPTPEAWSFHQLPPVILRLAVAFMFVVELAGPFLLLVPILAIRRVGVVFQAALQVGIIVTGNYNWFNFHTIVLLIPAWADDDYGDARGGSLLYRFCMWLPRHWGLLWSTFPGILVASVAAFASLAWTFLHICEVVELPRQQKQQHSGRSSIITWLSEALFSDMFRVNLNLGIKEVNQLSSTFLSFRCLSIFFAFVAASGLRHAIAPLSQGSASKGLAGLWRRVSQLASTLIRLVICIILLPLLALCLLPCDSIRHNVDGAIPFSSEVRPLERAVAPWHVSTAYGLFRRMTGVGESRGQKLGFGGLPPSIVAVPAVILEGSDDGAEWKEIPFRYAPGHPTQQPRRTAPHQPRLDWQMWFAALGSYEQNPFFVHLLYKILEGSEDVLALLDNDRSPWPVSSQPPRFLRSWLYHYDFTRLKLPWAHSIPGVRIINASDGIDEWWSRSRIREYAPAVSRESLEGIIRQQGWPVGATQRKAALAQSVDCSPARAHSWLFGSWCDCVVYARNTIAHTKLQTGWTVRSNIWREAWSLGSNTFFIDMNLVLIVSPLALLVLARFGSDFAMHVFFRIWFAPSPIENSKTKKKLE